jgi:hypothetical protein
MNNKILEIAAGMTAFSTFLGVLFAMIYYIYQIKKLGFLEAILYIVIYININLLFLYILKRSYK